MLATVLIPILFVAEARFARLKSVNKFQSQARVRNDAKK